MWMLERLKEWPSILYSRSTIQCSFYLVVQLPCTKGLLYIKQEKYKLVQITLLSFDLRTRHKHTNAKTFLLFPTHILRFSLIQTIAWQLSLVQKGIHEWIHKYKWRVTIIIIQPENLHHNPSSSSTAILRRSYELTVFSFV